MKKLLLPIIILLTISATAQTVEKIGCAKAVYVTENSNVLRGDVCIVYFCDNDSMVYDMVYETASGYMFKIDNLYGGQMVNMQWCIDKFPADKMLKLKAFEHKDEQNYKCEPFEINTKN